MARAIGQGYNIIGLTACPACEKEIPAKETKGGKLSLCCPWCDFSAYVNRGTKAHELMLAKVQLAAPAAAEASPPAPEKQTAPADNKQPDQAAGSAPPRRTSFASPLFGGS